MWITLGFSGWQLRSNDLKYLKRGFDGFVEGEGLEGRMLRINEAAVEVNAVASKV